MKEHGKNSFLQLIESFFTDVFVDFSISVTYTIVYVSGYNYSKNTLKITKLLNRN